MTQLFFLFMIATGTIIPEKKENIQDRQTYTICCADSKTYEFVYIEEIFEYIETGSFEYNEDLE
jgi:hypothetical protein